MKVFKDLEFEKHINGDGLQSKIFFDNGYGISVIRFKLSFGRYGSYTNNEHEWEIAVLTGNKDEWSLSYSTDITDDVIGHLSEEEVTEIMKRIQNLK